MSPLPTLLDRAAIEARIPHRPPFLFVDRIVALELAGETPALTAEWRVPEGSDFFRGHYPENPLTPGVILCEHVFQAGAILLIERFSEEAGGRVPVLARIERAKFKRIVRPGETLATEVRLAERVGPAFYIEGRARVGPELALEVRGVITQVEASAVERAR